MVEQLFNTTKVWGFIPYIFSMFYFWTWFERIIMDDNNYIFCCQDALNRLQTSSYMFCTILDLGLVFMITWSHVLWNKFWILWIPLWLAKEIVLLKIEFINEVSTFETTFQQTLVFKSYILIAINYNVLIILISSNYWTTFLSKQNGNMPFDPTSCPYVTTK